MTSVARMPRALSNRLRGLLPAPVVAALRGLVHGWGVLTARWRPTPDFIVVGAQRSGTTSLFRLLADHPRVRRPTHVKGVGYFDLQHHHGMRWYRGHFPLRRRDSDTLAFESSGYYLFHPLAAERIAAELPECRIVVVVRDPVERAWSAHHHEQQRGFETEDFERAIELEPTRLAGEAERLRADPTATSEEHRHHGYLARSRYSEQIASYLEHCGPDRVHVVDAGRLFSDTAAELALLERWLGLPSEQTPHLDRWNAGRQGKIDPGLRERLLAYFEPFDETLAAQMGRRPSWRSQPALGE